MRKYFQTQLDSGDVLVFFGVETTEVSLADTVMFGCGWQIISMSRDSVDNFGTPDGHEYFATMQPEGIPLFGKIHVNPHANYDRAMDVL